MGGGGEVPLNPFDNIAVGGSAYTVRMTKRLAVGTRRHACSEYHPITGPVTTALESENICGVSRLRSVAGNTYDVPRFRYFLATRSE